MRILKPIFLFAAALLTGISPAIAQPNWHKTYSDVDNRAIDYLSTNQYLLSGQTAPPMISGMNNTGVWPLRRIQLQLLNSSLNSNWFKTYVADDELMLYPLCNTLSTEFELSDARECSNGDFIVCGQVRRDGETSGSSCGGDTYHDVFLLRVDANGNPIWYKRYEVHGSLNSVVETADGGFMACGYIRTNKNHALILKTDGGGGLQWTKSYNPPAYWDPATFLTAEFTQVIRYGDYCALVGSANHSMVLNNVITMIIDDNGTVIADANYDLTDQGILLTGLSLCLVNDGSNDIAITGNGGHPCTSGSKLMIMKVDASLAIHFVKIYDDAGDPDYSATGHHIVNIGNKLIVVGNEWRVDHGLYAETDLNGNLLWFELFNNHNRNGVSMDVNTTLSKPVYSGAAMNAMESFVVLNQYNVNCWADPQSRTETELSPTVYNLRETIENPREISDMIHVFDLSNSVTTVCQPTPPPPPPVHTSPNGSGTSSYSGNNNVAMYPNPAVTSVKFSTSAESLNYTIRTVTGQLVMSGTATNGEAVNISELAKGVYFVQVEVNSEFKVLKLVKE